MIKNKKGNVENIVGIILGVVILIMILKVFFFDGLASSIIDAFSGLGPYGIFAGVLFVIALVVGIAQNIFKF